MYRIFFHLQTTNKKLNNWNVSTSATFKPYRRQNFQRFVNKQHIHGNSRKEAVLKYGFYMARMQYIFLPSLLWCLTGREGQDSCTAVMLCHYLFRAPLFAFFPSTCLLFILLTLVWYYKLLRTHTTFCIFIYMVPPNSVMISPAAAMKLYPDFGWDRVDSLCRDSYDAIFWHYDENSGDNTPVFWLLPSSAYTKSRTFLLLTLPCQQVSWGCTRSWEHTEPGHLTLIGQRDVPSLLYFLKNKN